jgi:hypothetical protein
MVQDIHDIFYTLKTGIAIGSPISGKVAEIFLQHIENQIIKRIMETITIITYKVVPVLN